MNLYDRAIAQGWTPPPDDDRFWWREDHGPVGERDLEPFLKVQCVTCGDLHQPGTEAIDYGEGSGICAWCHLGEFGVWPHGMTQPYEEDQDGETQEA